MGFINESFDPDLVDIAVSFSFPSEVGPSAQFTSWSNWVPQSHFSKQPVFQEDFLAEAFEEMMYILLLCKKGSCSVPKKACLGLPQQRFIYVLDGYLTVS